MCVTTKAAVIAEQGGCFTIEDVSLDALRDDEILVNIAGVGICHTDLACRDQYVPVPLPHVFGHEGSGVVEAVGAAVTGIEVGDHVVLSFNACGECISCKDGRPAYCHNTPLYNYAGMRPDGSRVHRSEQHEVLHGNFFGQSSFAGYAIAHQQNTVKVSKDVPVELLGPLGCGIQTGAGAVLNSFKVPAQATIAIYGLGTVGLSALMAAKLVACSQIIAVDINQQKLDKAREFGATAVINSSTEDAVALIHQLTEGGVDYALDCTGLPQVLRQVVDSLHATGSAGLLGLPPAGTEVSLDMMGLLFGKTLCGILEGDSVPQTFIPELIEHYRKGHFPFDQLITTYPFEEINQAVADLEQGKVIKPVLTP